MKPDRRSFTRLETDDEVLARATASCKHVVVRNGSCCALGYGCFSVDAVAESHGVQRRIIDGSR